MGTGLSLCIEAFQRLEEEREGVEGILPERHRDRMGSSGRVNLSGVGGEVEEVRVHKLFHYYYQYHHYNDLLLNIHSLQDFSTSSECSNGSGIRGITKV